MASKVFQGFKSLPVANFYLLLVVLMMGSISSLSGSDAIFEFNPALNNPPLDHLRIMMTYPAVFEESAHWDSACK